MCGEDSRPTFAEDGRQDDGLERSTYTITRLRHFRFFLDPYRWGFHCCCALFIIGSAGRRGSSCVYPLATLCLQYHYYYVLVAEATPAVDESGKTWQLLSNAWFVFFVALG